MKLKFVSLAIIFFQLIVTTANGQIAFTKSDTINIQNDSLVLKINKVRGDVSWQFSKDAHNWIELKDAKGDSLLISKLDSSGFFRAKIVDGNCLPVYSDSTYIVRKLPELEKQKLIEQAGQEAKNTSFFSASGTNTTISIVDSTRQTPIIEIRSTEISDLVKPGYLLIDTTEIGKIILVQDVKILKKANGFIEKLIEGIQVGVDFLYTDKELSISSPANRTKTYWNNRLKMEDSYKVPKYEVKMEDEETGLTSTLSSGKLTLSIANKKLWDYKDANNQLTITLIDGSIILNPALDLQANFKPIAVATALLPFKSPFLQENDYILKGLINVLKIITYNDFDIKFKFKVSGSLKEDIASNMKPKKIASYWYYIPIYGPVGISVKTELIARMKKLEAKADFTIEPEYEMSNNIILGITAKRVEENLEKEFIWDYSKLASGSYLAKGEISLDERFELVPRVEAYILGLTGLSGEIIPYQELKLNASTSNNSPLLYDCSIDAGVDANLSFDISAFHSDQATYSLLNKDFTLLAKTNLFTTPYSLRYLSGNNQTGIPGQQLPLPLEVQVRDSKDVVVPGYPVFFDVTSGGGFMNEVSTSASLLGVASNYWSLGNSGTQSARAYLKKTDQSIREGSTITFNASVQVPVPIANFSASKTVAQIGEGIQFTDLSTNNPTSWVWNFGDGHTSTERNPSHSYTLSGSYTVSLTAKNSAGENTKAMANYIAIGQSVVLPSVATWGVAYLSQTSVTSGGNVTSDGGATVTARGVCWNTTGNPTVADNHSTDGTGIGSFTSIVTGLTAGVTYYIRAYATNRIGTAYGSQMPGSIKAEATLPTLTTTTVSNITQTTATAGGNVTSDGGATVTARGVCWNTTGNPTVADNHTTDGSGTGNFTSSLTGLTANTTYYLRAYANNSKGTAYGDEVSLTTETAEGPVFGSFTDSRDGHVYKTVTIGTQVWMAENLAYLPTVSPPTESSNTDPYYYVYGCQGTSVAAAKAIDNYNTYGVLYNWPAAKAACPYGWHLPTDEEWLALERYLITNGYNFDGTTSENRIAKALAATTNWDSDSKTGSIGNNLSSNNKSGFSALPAGYRDLNGGFYNVGTLGYWWSSTENQYNSAYYRDLYYNQDAIFRVVSGKNSGHSVRCVKD